LGHNFSKNIIKLFFNYILKHLKKKQGLIGRWGGGKETQQNQETNLMLDGGCDRVMYRETSIS
jgi:hypothetical protein